MPNPIRMRLNSRRPEVVKDGSGSSFVQRVGVIASQLITRIIGVPGASRTSSGITTETTPRFSRTVTRGTVCTKLATTRAFLISTAMVTFS